MMARTFISLTLSIVLLLNCLPAVAFETDQFNLPPVPLADIGDEVSEYAEAGLRSSVDKVNADIAKSQTCLAATVVVPKGCVSAEEERKKLTYLRSNDAVAKEVSNLLGGGSLMFTKFGKWITSHKFKGEPSSYKTGYGESIYVGLPSNYLTISPTVRLYGTEFGIDKLEHFFQQGYKYYSIRRDAMAKGLSVDDAAMKAVKWGQRTERTYYGLWVSGVYSNADLYANFAGMKFYQALTSPMVIGDKTRPAPFVLVDGLWQFDASISREMLLKPFLTEHLNEALNPSGYAFNVYPFVRRSVRKYACAEWKAAFPDLTADSLTARSKALESWNGEEYGYTKRDRTVRVGEICYAGGSN